VGEEQETLSTKTKNKSFLVTKQETKCFESQAACRDQVMQNAQVPAADYQGRNKE
jgi:hypothetical protein